jgi:hypothetical protein
LNYGLVQCKPGNPGQVVPVKLPISLEIREGKAIAKVDICDIMEVVIPLIKDKIPEETVVAAIGLSEDFTALVIEVTPDLPGGTLIM